MGETKLGEEARANIGKRALLEVKPGLKFEVTIVDAKVAYGTAHYYIEPVAGSGRRRVRKDIEILN